MKKTKIIITAVILLSVGILATSAGYYFSYKSRGEQVAGEKTEISTLNWKTYSNTTYGYQFIYPNRWQIIPNKTGSSVVLTPDYSGEASEEVGINVSVKENASSFSSYDWIKNNFNGSDYLSRTLKACQYNQISCSEVSDYQEKVKKVVVFAKEKQVIVFNIIDEVSLPFAEKILSSFTFITATAVQDKTYTIKAGETLATIAAKFKMTWVKLAKYNKISSPDSIYAGQKIKIPADPGRISTGTVGSSIDYDLAKTYQERVDSGKEVWRLDPLEVAKREIPPQKGITAEDSFQIVTEDRQQGKVQIEISTKSNQKFLATLIQPTRNGSGGIWMVESITSK